MITTAWRTIVYPVRASNIRPGTVERAFELARDPHILTVEKIRKRLKAEGYIDWEFQLSGRQIRRQLQALVVAKRKPRPNDGEVQTGGEPALRPSA